MDEKKQIKRELWLSEHDRDEGDVMEDATGEEFIIYVNEAGKAERMYLPRELQKYYTPFDPK